MWLRQELPVAEFAPGADEFFPRFDEVNWALVFRSPALINNLGPRLVDLQECSGHDDWVHREIFRTNERICMASGREL